LLEGTPAGRRSKEALSMAIQLGLEPDDFGMNTWRAVAAEFIATALFVFVGTAAIIVAGAGSEAASGSAGPSPQFVLQVGLAFGLAIAVLVAATAKISGGHINPAVTFAAAATGKMKVSTAVLYIVAQLLAAIVGSLMLKTVIAGPLEGNLGATTLNVFVPGEHLGILDDQVGGGAGAGLLVEIALTFVLVFVVFATAMDPKGLAHLAPAAIGLAVLIDHMAGVGLTGASMNPARSFGPAVVAGEWDDQWVYWIGPLIGAALAALVYEYVFLNREE
jgi:MIP family channel proteins